MKTVKPQETASSDVKPASDDKKKSFDKKKPFDKKGSFEKKGSFDKKTPFKKNFNKEGGGAPGKPFVKNQKSTDKKPAAEVKLSIAEQKELKIKRKKQKLGENYETNVSMKKIWETLRRSVIHLEKK